MNQSIKRDSDTFPSKITGHMVRGQIAYVKSSKGSV